MDNPLRSRISERFRVTGKNKDDAAAYIGKGRTYLYDFLNGKSGSMNFDLLPKLAEFLECDPRYLTGEVPNPDGSEDFTLSLSGVIGPGSGEIEGTEVAVEADKRFPLTSQKAYLVQGVFHHDLGISDGSILITTTRIRPRIGSIVVVVVNDTSFALGVVRENGVDIFGHQRREDDMDDKIKLLGTVSMEVKMFDVPDGEPEVALA